MDSMHSPEGNKFDDIRLDLDEAFRYASQLREASNLKTSVRRSKIHNTLRLLRDGALVKGNLQEAVVTTGVSRQWFKEFQKFWTDFLDGRPLTVSDFLMLRFHYRIKFQKMEAMDWSSIDTHLQNWKQSENFYLLFNGVFSSALRPYRNLNFLKSGKTYRILEYGCSHAPYFRSWRNYFSHINAQWTLADIKNAASLFSLYSYKDIQEIEEFIILDSENVHNPFTHVNDPFDVVILTTVLEHVHNPQEVVSFLTENLRPGGFFVFDYIKSTASGLDTIQGLEGREETLRYIADNYTIISGSFKDFDQSIDLCVGVRR